MSLYTLGLITERPALVRSLPDSASRQFVTVSVEPETLCAMLEQAFRQELSMAYVERWLAEYKAKEAQNTPEDAENDDC